MSVKKKASKMVQLFLSTLVVALFATITPSTSAFALLPHYHQSSSYLPHYHQSSSYSSSLLPLDMATAAAAAVDVNEFNVPLEQAAALWTVSVAPENFLDRIANKPYLDSKQPADYYVDDVELTLLREAGSGLGMELLELAGGRPDGVGLTIIEGVVPDSPAARAGVLPGDSIAGVTLVVQQQQQNDNNNPKDEAAALAQQTTVFPTLDCECRDFDGTIAQLSQIPAPSDGTSSPQTLVVQIKRLRRWPKVNVTVEYPPVQVTPGVDPTERFQLQSGENLLRALQARQIILEDPDAPKCDFCGLKCQVQIDQGMNLLSPPSTTEAKILQNNPQCRLACKTTVGHQMREGDLKLRINLFAWKYEQK